MENKVKSTSSVVSNFTISLTEGEAAALNAIAIYGADEFLRVFYTHLGKAYLEPYEKDMRSLFLVLKGELSPHLSKAKKAREILIGH